ncbi:MAG: hypothetical protein QG573_2799 [Acidobacteriota bacterium]|nr:hypothetical protein [Acidobacteriota bacterium]
MSRRRRPTALLLAFLAGPAFAAPPEYIVDGTRSLFAVLTHKAGIAAGLAHDHLVVAVQAKTRLEFDPATPEATRFTFSTAADGLEIDAPGPRAAWRGRFKELGIHSGELPPVADSDRTKVRAAMLGASQLDGAKFPEIGAEVVALTRSAPPASGWIAKVQLVIHGKTVERSLPATWSEKEGTLTAEIWGEFRFLDFGIEPYSTMLGAIRNDDRFHLYVSVVARRAP